MKRTNQRPYISGEASWKRKTRARDFGRCQCCGVPAEESNHAHAVHHLHGYRQFEALRVDRENGVTLCRRCHTEFHSQYGRDCTVEQYREFAYNRQHPCECGGRYITRKTSAICRVGTTSIAVKGLPALVCEDCGTEQRIYGALLSAELKRAFEDGERVVYMTKQPPERYVAA